MDSLFQTEFAPLAEVKAKLSAFVKETLGGRRLLITSHGRPQAVLISYPDYLSLLQTNPNSGDEPVRIIDFQNWKREKAKRKEIRSSILGRFNPSALPRKGQKKYKRKRVEQFEKNSS